MIKYHRRCHLFIAAGNSKNVQQPARTRRQTENKNDDVSIKKTPIDGGRELEKNFNPNQCGFLEILFSSALRPGSFSAVCRLFRVPIRKFSRTNETKKHKTRLNLRALIAHKRQSQNSIESIFTSHSHLLKSQTNLKFIFFCWWLGGKNFYAPRQSSIKVPSTRKFITHNSILLRLESALGNSGSDWNKRKAKPLTVIYIFLVVCIAGDFFFISIDLAKVPLVIFALRAVRNKFPMRLNFFLRATSSNVTLLNKISFQLQ